MLKMILESLIGFLNLREKLGFTSLTDAQRQTLEAAAKQIAREIPNINAHATGQFPLFKSKSHKKAVMEDSWEQLSRYIPPVTSIPGLKRQSKRVMKFVNARAAKSLVECLPKLENKIKVRLLNSK